MSKYTLNEKAIATIVWLEKRWFLVVMGVLFFLQLPVLVFILRFRESNFANDISKWGAFGDYIGGMINPFISLMSLIVLGYITYIISRKEDLASKKLLLLEKKIEFIETFNKKHIAFFLAFINIKHFYDQFISERNRVNAVLFNGTIISNDIEKDLKYTLECAVVDFKTILEFTSFFKFINLSHSYLFDYNFDSDEFKVMYREVLKLESRVNLILNEIRILPINDLFNCDGSIYRFSDDDLLINMGTLIFELQAEISKETRVSPLVKSQQE